MCNWQESEVPEWAVPEHPPSIDPLANKHVAAARRAEAKAKAKGKAKPDKAKAKAKATAKKDPKPKKTPKQKNESTEKTNASEKQVQGQSLYGKAKQDFKESYTGSKADFENSWRESSKCQEVLRQMPWKEVKKRKFDHLWIDSYQG